MPPGILPAVAVCPSEQQLKIAILVLSGAVLVGGAALLSEHRLSATRVRAATDEPAAVDRGSGPSSLGPRPGEPRAAHVHESPPVAASDRPQSSTPLPGADGQPGSSLRAGVAPTPTVAEAQAIEADNVAAPKPAAHPHDAPRVNPTSGEQMWSPRDVIRDGGEADQPLCGGQLCRVGQFCCGPPACGRCAYPMAGPHCPGTCPGQKSN
jgi:hypothetical protein